MGSERTLTVRILGDSAGAQKAFAQLDTAASGTMGRLDAVGQKFRDVGSKMVGVGSRLTLGVTTPLALLGKKSFDAASDMNESMSKVSTVFGDAADDIDAFSKTAARSLGLSRQEALDAAGTFGNMFTQLGIGAPKAAGMSKQMIQLATDLGSFHNADISEVINAQTSAFRGEYDALQRFIPTINAATVEQKALELTGKKTTKELTDQEKALAVQKLMMEGAGAAAGDFARTADGAANKQRIATAQFKDAAATLGTTLLPIGQKVIGFFSDLATRFGELSPRMQNFILIGAGIAAALGPVVTVVGALVAVIGAVLSPVGLVIVGIAALVAGLVYAYTHFEGFRDVIATVVDFIGGTVLPAVANLAGFLMDQLGAAVEWVKRMWPQISEAIGHVLRVAREVIGVFVDWASAVWRAWGDDIFAIVRTAFDFVKGTIDNVLQTIRGVISTALAIINGDWGRAWDGIKQVFAGVWDQIVNVLRTAIGILGSVIGGIVSAFAEVLRPLGNLLHTWIIEPLEKVIGFVTNMPGRIGRAAAGMFDGIKNAFRSAINFIIRAWNGLEFRIPGFDPPGPGPSFGGATIGVPNIPLLAHGGIVKARPGGTLALIGEAGQDEAVIPLPRGATAVTAAPSVVISKGAVQVAVNGSPGMDEAMLARLTRDAVEESYKELVRAMRAGVR